MSTQLTGAQRLFGDFAPKIVELTITDPAS
jgi:hypothetical protein